LAAPEGVFDRFGDDRTSEVAREDGLEEGCLIEGLGGGFVGMD